MISSYLQFGRRWILFLTAFIIALQTFAQQPPEKKAAAGEFRVTGKVSNNGELLPGANLLIKGTKTKTTTDINGHFSIMASSNAILQVSYVGMETKELKIANASPLTIELKAQGTAMDEVVVVGFGIVKKRDLTGSVVSVKSEEITARPGPNPMESLQGRVAGLDITRSSGQAGAGVNLQLRGTRSFSASSAPLFIINGLPGDYATLNPNDIETIDILKDASSTAVYGSAGSNGVVIITTKSGKEGKLAIDLNSFFGYNGWSVTPKMRSGNSYLQTKRDAYKYIWDATAKQWTRNGALWQSDADDEEIFGTQRYQTFKEGQFTDWADLFMRKNAVTQNYSISASGGTDKTKAYLSFNYSGENGQYIGDDYNLLSTNMRIEHKVKPWLTIGTNMQASYVMRNKAQDKLESALTTDPLARPYKADGTLNPDLGNNVYNLLLNYQPGVYANLDNNTGLFINPYIEIKPLKGLSFLSRVGGRLNYANTYQFDGIGSVAYTYNNAGIAKAQISQNREVDYQWENILTYNFQIAKVHDITLTGVTTYYDNQDTKTDMLQSNILSNNFKWYNFRVDPANTTATSSYTMSRTLGLVGRVNYSYDGKYLFSASIRRDGSSVLYSDRRWDLFPALSAGWRISDEKFMEGSKDWLNNLKARFGWGVTGSSNIPPYSSQNIMESLNSSLGGETVPIYRNSQYITNPELGWEKSYNTNYGIDAGFFNSRIDVALDYYSTRTKGVIYSVSAPVLNGTYKPGTQYLTNKNICETLNRGLELTLNTRNIVSRNFEWTTAAAFSYNKEQIIKLTGGVANNIVKDDYALTIGEPVSSFRNFKLDGVWQIGQEADAAVFNKRPGDLKVNVPDMTKVAEGVFMKKAANGTDTYYYTDLAAAQQFNPALTAANSRYSYSANDYQTLGQNSPVWSLGLQNTFKYKSFDLGVYAYFRWGQMIKYNMLGWYQPNGFATNASPSRTIPEYFNYWTPENPSNDFPVMDYLATTSTMTGFSGLSYVNGSFFKVKNITLGYTLPNKTLKKFGIQKFRFYGTMTNPLVLAKSHLIKQYDPEMNGVLSYPLTKQVVIGLNVSL